MIKFRALIAELSGLGVAKDSVLLVGSAALAIRGIRDVNDLDVIASDEVCAGLASQADDCDGKRLAFITPNGVITVATEFSSFAAQARIPVGAALAASDVWEGWHIVSLHHLKDFKRSVGREKDLDDLRAIELWEAKT